MSSDALQNRAVLAVHRDNFATALPACLFRERTIYDEVLLVRQRNALARSTRSARGVAPGGSYN